MYDAEHWTEFWRRQVLYQHRFAFAWMRACTAFLRALAGHPQHDSGNVVNLHDYAEAGNNAARAVGNRFHGSKR